MSDLWRSLRWFSDTVERVTFSDGRVVDKPNYRLQYRDAIELPWRDVPCVIAEDATIIEVDLRTPNCTNKDPT